MNWIFWVAIYSYGLAVALLTFADVGMDTEEKAAVLGLSMFWPLSIPALILRRIFGL